MIHIDPVLSSLSYFGYSRHFHFRGDENMAYRCNHIHHLSVHHFQYPPDLNTHGNSPHLFFTILGAGSLGDNFKSQSGSSIFPSSSRNSGGLTRVTFCSGGGCICGGGGAAGECTAALWWPSIAMWCAVVGSTSAWRSCLVLYWQPSWEQVSIVTLFHFSSFYWCFFRLLEENVYIIESQKTSKNETSFTRLNGFNQQTFLYEVDECNKFWNKYKVWKTVH